MTTFIATLGFDSTRVTRPVLRQGLEEGDQIILVQPVDNDNPRANEAKEDVRRMVTELQPNVSVDSLILDPTEFYENICRTAKWIDETEDSVVLVLGGGARDIYLPVSFVAFIRQASIDAVLQFSDITGSVTELIIPNFTNPPGESVVNTLGVITDEENGATLTLISNSLGVAKSTVARHVSQLEEQNLVRAETHGKNKVVYPTEQGVLATDLNVF